MFLVRKRTSPFLEAANRSCASCSHKLLYSSHTHTACHPSGAGFGLVGFRMRARRERAKTAKFAHAQPTATRPATTAACPHRDVVQDPQPASRVSSSRGRVQSGPRQPTSWARPIEVAGRQPPAVACGLRGLARSFKRRLQNARPNSSNPLHASLQDNQCNATPDRVANRRCNALLSRGARQTCHRTATGRSHAHGTSSHSHRPAAVCTQLRCPMAAVSDI